MTNRTRGNHRRRLSARTRRAVFAIGREVIKCCDGKPFRRLMADGRYKGVDGKVYDD
jgi:hypothetical protein